MKQIYKTSIIILAVLLAVTVSDMDSGIIVIMNEEMPAYYSGQKSLDEVTQIVENRVILCYRNRDKKSAFCQTA